MSNTSELNTASTTLNDSIKYKSACATTVEPKIEDESAVKVSELSIYQSPVPSNAGFSVMESKDLLQEYLKVNSTSPLAALTQEKRHTLYNRPGDEALYGTARTYLTGIENKYVMDWENLSDATTTYTQSYTTGYACTKSEEMDVSLGLSFSFEGLEVGGPSVGYKSFTSVETSSTTTQTAEVAIPPRTSVYMYQRRFHFRTRAYFTLDCWDDLWLAGSNGGYTIQWGEVDSYIDAQDYLTLDHKLGGETVAKFDSQKAEPLYGNYVRKFENLSGLARDTLRSIGIDGSQD